VTRIPDLLVSRGRKFGRNTGPITVVNGLRQPGETIARAPTLLLLAPRRNCDQSNLLSLRHIKHRLN
jgi:hypothetical protein